MPKDFSRTRRVAEQIQRELAMLIQQEIKDPRLGMVTVSGVDVTKDLSVAKVYVSVLDESHDVKQTLEVLNRAAGFLRHALGQSLVMRAVPHLHFHFDDSISRGNELSSLINDAVAADKKKHKD
ncbi:MAG: 30S ribosome-binding factor RbfA [Gammaproteobacteria bacterium]|nr:30S ribosome-binding factor RbfA [Gammaproteobacteria bacterium]